MIALVAASVLALPAASGAATVKVTNTNDSGAGSLRAAIKWANGLSGATIVIEATGTIQLQSGLPYVETAVAIRGPGAAKLSVDGAALTLEENPPFSVTPDGRASLRGISIENAVVGIGNAGTLTVNRTRFIECLLAINNNISSGSRLTVLDSTFFIPSTSGSAGISNGFAGNTAVIRRSTIDGFDTAIENNGYETPNPGHLAVSRSTLSHTLVAVYNRNATAVIDRSTLGDYFSSGIDNQYGSVTVIQSTLSGQGGIAIFNRDGVASTRLRSTIVANSQSGNNCFGTVTSVGFNLADDGSCNLTAQGDQPNTDPMLRPLGDYFGPTKSFALPRTSPAIDAGFAGSTLTDQRGVPRIVDYPGVPKAVGGDNSDIGAFELQAP